MYCTNCGWSNPDGVEFCQKCNEPLAVSSDVVVDSAPCAVAPSQPDVTPASYEISGGDNATVLACPKCGYPMSSKGTCPNCGALYVDPSSAPAPVKAPAPQETPESYSNKATLRNAASFVAPEPVVAPESVAVPEPKSAPVFSGKATIRDFSSFIEDTTPVAPSVAPAAPVEEKDISLTPVTFYGEKLQPLAFAPGEYAVVENVRVSSDNGRLLLENTGDADVYLMVKHPVELEKGDIVIIGSKRYQID